MWSARNRRTLAVVGSFLFISNLPIRADNFDDRDLSAILAIAFERSGLGSIPTSLKASTE